MFEKISLAGVSNADWLRLRKSGIGGSDAGAICGLNPYSSAMKVFQDKISDTLEVTDNESMRIGRDLEDYVAKRFTEATGLKVRKSNYMYRSVEHPFMIADIDGLTTDDSGEPAILECKCVSEFKRSEWETDIPVYYRTQVEHYLAVTGLSTAYVAALIGGNTFVIREVHADKEMQAMLVAVEADFWRKVVNMERPEPDASDACKNLLDSIYRGGISEQVVLPDEALEYLDMYIEACAMEDSAKEKKQLASNNLKEIMGDYNTAKCQGYTVSWKPVTSERLDTKALKEAEPEIYAKFVKSSTSRRFSVK